MKRLIGLLILIGMMGLGARASECQGAMPGYMIYLLSLPARSTQDIRPVGQPTVTTTIMKWSVVAVAVISTHEATKTVSPTNPNCPANPGGITDPATGPQPTSPANPGVPVSGSVPCPQPGGGPNYPGDAPPYVDIPDQPWSF